MAMRAFQLQALVLLGAAEHAERVLAAFGDRDPDCGELSIAAAVLRLEQKDPIAALARR